MLIMRSKLIVALVINFFTSLPVSAKTVEQNTLDFPVKTEELLKGEIHYYFSILSPREIGMKHPDLFDLDSLSLAQESDVKLVINKSVSVVKKPVGFFEEQQMLDEKYLAHVMGDQKIKKISPNTYLVTVPGNAGHTYRTQSFFDADDLSTLPNSKVIRAVSAAKKLDVISKGASTIMFSEKTQYTKFTEGGVSVSSFIPLKENKTLVITYNLWAVRKRFALGPVLKASFLREVQAVKKLQESF